MSLSGKPSRTSRDFERVITWSAALSMALVAGFLASLKQIDPTLKFQFSAMVVAVALGAGGLTAAIFGMIFRFGHDDSGESRKRLTWHWRVVFLLLSGSALMGFILVTVKYVPAGRRADILIGEITAVSVVSLGGWLCWRLMRFLESQDDDQTRDEDRDKSE